METRPFRTRKKKPAHHGGPVRILCMSPSRRDIIAPGKRRAAEDTSVKGRMSVRDGARTTDVDCEGTRAGSGHEVGTRGPQYVGGTLLGGGGDRIALGREYEGVETGVRESTQGEDAKVAEVDGLAALGR